jgi:hypothetical protein
VRAPCDRPGALVGRLHVIRFFDLMGIIAVGPQ